MVVVRLVFQTKYGKAQEVVDQFKRDAAIMRRAFGKERRARLYTDLSGPFHTVVQEIEVESLAEWEQMRAKMFTNPEFQEAQSSMTEMPFESGRTEYYTLEANL
jgi:hypothetical protein